MDTTTLEPVIEVKNLNKTFRKQNTGNRNLLLTLFSKKEKLKVLNDINFEVYPGEFLGIVGRNGSGKSTLLRIIMGTLKGDKGTEVKVRGKMIRMALGMGFDQNLTARQNIYLNGTVLGLSFKKIGELFHAIIDFAELSNFIDTPIKYYSSGMKSRLAFSIAIHAEADIFLMDEFFGGVGDESF